jgi:large subunit ribosomal protein L17
MRHRNSRKQLSRSTSHRKALRQNMARALFQHGAIRTTEVKAKQLRGFVEKLITTAKKGTLHARRLVVKELGDRLMFDDEGDPMDQTVVQKLFDEVAPRYADRPGGYTRIIRISDTRIGDAGRQVILQLVEEEAAEGDSGGTSRRKARAAKRHEAAEAAEAIEGSDSATATAVADEEAEEESAEAPEAEADAEASADEEASDNEESNEDEKE